MQSDFYAQLTRHHDQRSVLGVLARGIVQRQPRHARSWIVFWPAIPWPWVYDGVGAARRES